MSHPPMRSSPPRSAPRAGASLLGLLACLAACGGDNLPCYNACAPIEGSYGLVFESTGIPDDCQTLGITLSNGTLTITRVGSDLNGTFTWGDQLAGTLYDTSDFTLSAVTGQGQDLDSVSIRGVYHPPLHAGSASSLTGSWFETHQRSAPTGTKTCTIDRTFIGAPQ